MTDALNHHIGLRAGAAHGFSAGLKFRGETCCAPVKLEDGEAFRIVGQPSKRRPRSCRRRPSGNRAMPKETSMTVTAVVAKDSESCPLSHCARAESIWGRIDAERTLVSRTINGSAYSAKSTGGRS